MSIDQILNLSWYHVVGFGLFYFSVLYGVTGAITVLLTRQLLPQRGHGSVLDPRPLPDGQLAREWRQSVLSILIFGTGLLFPWLLLRLGWARIDDHAGGVQMALEIAALTLWNEVHFYANHRLLHTRWFKRFHLPHHRSVITTPWSTYSFHPVEAVLLGNVIILPMLLHDFSLAALLALPVISIVFNNIGHSNYDFLPGAAHDRWWLNGARRHHLHHLCYQGNFGFMLPFLDRWFGTDLPVHAADARLRRTPPLGPTP